MRSDFPSKIHLIPYKLIQYTLKLGGDSKSLSMGFIWFMNAPYSKKAKISY